MARFRSVLMTATFMLIAGCLLAAPPQEPQTEPEAKPQSQPVAIDEEPRIDWRSIVPDIYHDQRRIWTFPVRLAHGQDWKPALGFTLALGGLIALDPHDTPYFRNNGT